MLLNAILKVSSVPRSYIFSNKVTRQMSTALRFVVDFDETLTATDTTSLIASLNTKNNVQWKEFEKRYLDGFTKQSKLALTRALNTKSMMNYFEDMAAFESKSIRETIEGRHLRGISSIQLKDLAKNIKPKECMHAALNKLLEISGANPIHVLSLSWSKYVIKEFLSFQFPSYSARFIVHANDLQAEVDEISNGARTDLDLATAAFVNYLIIGNIINGIHTAQDKANHVRQIKAEMESRNESAKLVGIGDSLNDLLALLSADYGILLGSFDDNSKVVQLCALDHISLKAVTELDLTKPDKTIFVADTWHQLTEALKNSRKS